MTVLFDTISINKRYSVQYATITAVMCVELMGIQSIVMRPEVNRFSCHIQSNLHT